MTTTNDSQSPWSTLFSIASEQTKKAFFAHYEEEQQLAEADWDLIVNCQDEALENAAKAAEDAATVAALRVYEVYEDMVAKAAESEDPGAGLDEALKVLADAAFYAASESFMNNTGDLEFEITVAMALKATDEAFLHQFGDEDGQENLTLAGQGVSPHAENWYAAYDAAYKYLAEEVRLNLTVLTLAATQRAIESVPKETSRSTLN